MFIVDFQRLYTGDYRQNTALPQFLEFVFEVQRIWKQDEVTGSNYLEGPCEMPSCQRSFRLRQRRWSVQRCQHQLAYSIRVQFCRGRHLGVPAVRAFDCRNASPGCGWKFMAMESQNSRSLDSEEESHLGCQRHAYLDDFGRGTS